VTLVLCKGPQIGFGEELKTPKEAMDYYPGVELLLGGSHLGGTVTGVHVVRIGRHNFQVKLGLRCFPLEYIHHCCEVKWPPYPMYKEYADVNTEPEDEEDGGSDPEDTTEDKEGKGKEGKGGEEEGGGEGAASAAPGPRLPVFKPSAVMGKLLESPPNPLFGINLAVTPSLNHANAIAAEFAGLPLFKEGQVFAFKDVSYESSRTTTKIPLWESII